MSLSRMSDDCVMLSLKDEFGITDGQQIQKLSKEERDVIVAALLRRHAGVRQLQRLSAEIDKISKMEAYQDYGSPFCISLWE